MVLAEVAGVLTPPRSSSVVVLKNWDIEGLRRAGKWKVLLRSFCFHRNGWFADTESRFEET